MAPPPGSAGGPAASEITIPGAQEGRVAMSTVHKPGQGVFVRRFAMGALSIIVITGGMAFYRWLVNSNWRWLQWPKSLLSGYSTPIPLLNQKIDLAFVTSWALTGLGLFWLYRFLSKPSRVDFLVDTEEELKKVTWPSWREAKNASIIVLIFICFLAAYLLIADLGLSKLLDFILGSGA